MKNVLVKSGNPDSNSSKMKASKSEKMTRYEELHERYRDHEPEALNEEMVVLLALMNEKLVVQGRKIKNINSIMNFFFVITIIGGIIFFFTLLAGLGY